jgi:S-adenosylmethionine:tRNA ribosyltransferase-isomerase
MGSKYRLYAEKSVIDGEAWRVRFTWDCSNLSFGEVIEAIGHVPLPPYITRADETEDSSRYQTVYSTIRGSVAAPTAGLHFTLPLLDKLNSMGIESTEVTLHVGAGTFKPVKSRYISGHMMHSEHFFVTARTIKMLIETKENIIAVGTTSVRTLESLFWMGVKLRRNIYFNKAYLSLEQWEPYELAADITVKESLIALLDYMEKNGLTTLHASTSMIIVPGYEFRMINGLITNFHQPGSTLLLLVSAWIGERWKRVYKYALDNDFRFLSYGDSSLLIRK